MCGCLELSTARQQTRLRGVQHLPTVTQLEMAAAGIWTGLLAFKADGCTPHHSGGALELWKAPQPRRAPHSAAFLFPTIAEGGSPGLEVQGEFHARPHS